MCDCSFANCYYSGTNLYFLCKKDRKRKKYFYKRCSSKKTEKSKQKNKNNRKKYQSNNTEAFYICKWILFKCRHSDFFVGNNRCYCFMYMEYVYSIQGISR